MISERETYALRRISEGADNRTLASEMYLSPGRIRQVLSGLYDLIGVPNRVAAVAWYVRHYG